MPKFKLYNQNQPMLLPLNIKDCLPADHICFIIDDVVNNLDLNSIEKSYSEDGRPAYNPQMLIKVMFFSYSQGMRSSRKIERLTYENIPVRFLAANQNPDHGTISLFRKDHLEDLTNIFTQIVMLCNGLGMINPTDISIDGSIFKANASKKATYNQETIDKLRKKIKEILQQAEKIDNEENKKNDDETKSDKLSEKLINKETRNKEIILLQDKLQKLQIAEKAIKEKQNDAKTAEEKKFTRNNTHNITDSDAILMKVKNSKTYRPSYNGQIASSKQVITAYDIFDETSDANLFKPMIEKIEKTTGQKVKKVKLDSGYFSQQNIEYLNGKKIDAYIPDQRKAIEEWQERNNEIPTYDRRNFTYDKKKNEFICPENKRLIQQGYKNKAKKYICLECGSCPVKTKCAKGKNRYVHYNQQLETYKTEMRKKLNIKQGKNKYLERLSEVEPVFGNIIHNQNAWYFLCRGKPKIKIEFGLSCIAHNLVKISNWIKKNDKNIKDLQLNTLMRLPATA